MNGKLVIIQGIHKFKKIIKKKKKNRKGASIELLGYRDSPNHPIALFFVFFLLQFLINSGGGRRGPAP